jgi:hypothetical protein
MSKITRSQLFRLLQIDEYGEGIGFHIEELINRLTSHNATDQITDSRRVMARHLWDLGFGCFQGSRVRGFDIYLDSIPQIPLSLLVEDPELSFLSLADPRLGILQVCRLLGIQYEELKYVEGDSVPFDERFKIPQQPFWFRHDDGRVNRNRRPNDCRRECVGGIQVGTAMEGIFAFVHHPQIIAENEHVIDCPGTVYRTRPVLCGCIGMWSGQVKLGLVRHPDITNPCNGSIRVRRK